MLLRLGAVAMLLIAMAAVILGSPPGSPAFAQQQAEDFDIPNGHFYTQTRGSYPAGSGFAVVDDGIMFWTSLRQLGGVAVVGFPISQRFVTNGRVAQGFQRLILIWDSTTGQASVQQTGTNLALIPSDALVPAPWTGRTGGMPGGGAPNVGPGYGQAPYGQAPYGQPYGQPYGPQPCQPYYGQYGQPYGQQGPYYGAPYGQPYADPYAGCGAPYGYPYGTPYYDPYAPAAPWCDPWASPWGCPQGPAAPVAPWCDPFLSPWGCPSAPVVVYPTATNTPVPSGPSCNGDNTQIYIEPQHPAVGQRTLIRVTSSYGWEDVGLNGPLGPRFEGLGPGGLNWVWTWSVTPPGPGTFEYTFTINSGSGCVTSGFSTAGFTPPATSTPIPPHNTATPTNTPVHGAPAAPPAQQPPVHNPPVQQPPVHNPPVQQPPVHNPPPTATAHPPVAPQRPAQQPAGPPAPPIQHNPPAQPTATRTPVPHH